MTKKELIEKVNKKFPMLDKEFLKNRTVKEMQSYLQDKKNEYKNQKQYLKTKGIK